MTCNHEFYEGYYGTHCRKCDWFAAFGCEPWNIPTDEEQAQIDREEYEATHGTCPYCGGEWGDGWSSCTCDDEPADWDDRRLFGPYSEFSEDTRCP